MVSVPSRGLLIYNTLPLTDKDYELVSVPSRGLLIYNLSWSFVWWCWIPRFPSPLGDCLSITGIEIAVIWEGKWVSVPSRGLLIYNICVLLVRFLNLFPSPLGDCLSITVRRNSPDFDCSVSVPSRGLLIYNRSTYQTVMSRWCFRPLSGTAYL